MGRACSTWRDGKKYILAGSLGVKPGRTYMQLVGTDVQALKPLLEAAGAEVARNPLHLWRATPPFLHPGFGS